MTGTACRIDRDGVMKALPHREEMLMIDCVTELERGRRAIGYKDIINGEFWCAGHFPGESIFPGVLVIEMMAQISALAFYRKGGPEAKPLLAKVDNVKFLSKVTPGCRLFVEAVLDAEIAGFFRMKCRAFRDGEDVAVGKLTCCMKHGDAE
ncbi:MAG: beta-hydroxyacyl-ACP dehydratase [Synergistaceae bacterium]|jgi:3-hydroxyacyl-[acyl-carrier-protein] dehydratase|nr:beta-hydroxyacyl-ACP dehydratase [Synergistaceae bacterium]